MTRGLSPFESARLSRCLDRLAPHLRLDSIAVTGGVGIQLGLAALERAGQRDRMVDLDLVATSVTAVSASVCAHFLVSHYHVVRPGVPKFLIQLIDPVLRLRIDVFPDLAGSIADARGVQIGRHRMPVLPLERILEHKVQTLLRASPPAPIDPKHAQDAVVLGATLGLPVPAVGPEVLAPDLYGVNEARACERCALSSDGDWPLASTDRIVALLGWERQSDVRASPVAARQTVGP
jgi:hypothetical protein